MQLLDSLVVRQNEGYVKVVVVGNELAIAPGAEESARLNEPGELLVIEELLHHESKF